MSAGPRLEAAVKAWDHHWGDRYGDEAMEEMGDEVAVALAAADAVDPLRTAKATENLAIDSGWLVERDPNGGDFIDGYGMLPGSDCTSLVHLAELPGWLAFTEAEIEQVAWELYKLDHPEHAARSFEQVGEPIRANRIRQARAVVAALRGGEA